MTAVAIHQIAVALYQLDEKAHRGDIDSIMNWDAPIEQYELHGRWETKPHFPPRPSLFFHPDYLNHQQYPSGTADVAGYWAEDRIFGGVVLFDRGKSDIEVSYIQRTVSGQALIACFSSGETGILPFWKKKTDRQGMVAPRTATGVPHFFPPRRIRLGRVPIAHFCRREELQALRCLGRNGIPPYLS